MTHLTYIYGTHIYRTESLAGLLSHFDFLKRVRVPEGQAFSVAGQGPSMAFKTLGPNRTRYDCTQQWCEEGWPGRHQWDRPGCGIAYQWPSHLRQKLVSTAKGPSLLVKTVWTFQSLLTSSFKWGWEHPLCTVSGELNRRRPWGAQHNACMGRGPISGC